MDFATCPACDQSVLDDDAENCPFCGASMSEKPSKSSAVRPQSATAPAGGSTQAKPVVIESAGRKAAPATSGDSDDEDPFAIEPAATTNAIRVSPKPMKGRRHQIICPMCETPGYVSSKASEKEVRCVNPDCLVPVFTAPVIETKKQGLIEDAPPQTSGFPMPVILGVAAVGLLVAAGLWHFVFNAPTNLPKPTEIGPTIARDQPPTEPPVVDVTPTKNEAKDPEPIAKAPTRAELIERTLKLMVETSQETTANRSKPYCRRLTAEAFAQTGDLEGARDQLKRLEKVGRQTRFYRITPLVAIAWKELAADQTDEANRTLDDALTSTAELPRIGRDSLDIATALSTVLVAAGRSQDARSLLSSFLGRHNDTGRLGQLSQLLLSVRQRQTYDLETEIAAEPLFAWTAPVSVAVTRGLAARGYWEQARGWSEAAGNVEERTDCLTAWAAALAEYALRTQRPERLKALDDATKTVSAAARVRIYARVAGVQLAMGDRSQAEQSLLKARADLDSIPPPLALELGNLKQVYRLVLPDPVPLRMAALAVAETARVEAALGQAEKAAGTLEIALDFLRAMAPSPLAIGTRLDEIDRLGTGAVRRRLKTVLNIDNNDEALRAFRKYRQQCGTIAASAKARFDLQATLLARASRWTISDKVWSIVRTRSVDSDLNKRELYYRTSVPWLLLDRYRDDGNDERVNEIQAALENAKLQPDPRQLLKQTTTQLVAAGRFEEAAAHLNRPNLDESFRQRWAMTLACRLVREEKIEAAFALTQALVDPVLREQTFELISALAARSGKRDNVVAVRDSLVLPPTEAIAICRGLIAGMAAGSADNTAESGGGG